MLCQEFCYLTFCAEAATLFPEVMSGLLRADCESDFLFRDGCAACFHHNRRLHCRKKARKGGSTRFRATAAHLTFAPPCATIFHRMNTVYHSIAVPQTVLVDFCHRYRICRLSFFGSVLRDDFGPDSDVDVLVEFEPGHVPGLLRMAQIEGELSELLGRKADVRTAAELSRHFRDDVLKEAQVQYAAA